MQKSVRSVERPSTHVVDMRLARCRGSHLFAANDGRDPDEYPDDEREEQRERDRAARRTGCQCFGPGEAGGTCPGPDNCPMAGDDHD